MTTLKVLYWFFRLVIFYLSVILWGLFKSRIIEYFALINSIDVIWVLKTNLGIIIFNVICVFQNSVTDYNNVLCERYCLLQTSYSRYVFRDHVLNHPIQLVPAFPEIRYFSMSFLFSVHTHFLMCSCYLKILCVNLFDSLQKK